MPYREMHNQDELDSSGSLQGLFSPASARSAGSERLLKSSTSPAIGLIGDVPANGRDIRDMILRKKLKPVGEERAKSFSEETA